MDTLNVPTFRTVTDPRVVLTVDPITRSVTVEITETCPTCSGYGSPCGGGCHGSGFIRHSCDVSKNGIVETLTEVLGAEATKITLDTIGKLIGTTPSL